MKTFYCLALKFFWFIYFVLYLLFELVLSSIKVAFDVLTPSLYAKPGVVGVPIQCETDLEMMLLASAISLTPGTLTLDISADKKMLYVHSMFAGDLEKLKQTIQSKLERPILEVLR